MTGCSRIAAMIFSSPPRFGQCSMPIHESRLSSLAQPWRTGRRCARLVSQAAGCVLCAGGSGA